jgi:tRNA(fMet)-specific endonuclease VapC
MRRALLDTDAISEILKGKNELARKRGAEYLAAFGRFTISTVSVMEVVKGLHKRGRVAQLQRFTAGLASMEVLPLESDAAVIAGRIYADLETAGQPIGRADPMIAGIAIARSLVLITGNVAHYARVQQLGHALEIENWLRP